MVCFATATQATSITINPVNPLSMADVFDASIYVVHADHDRVGAWDEFYGGSGRVSGIRNDFAFSMTADADGEVVIDSITIFHNSNGEVWSTSVDTVSVKPYPLVVTDKYGDQINTNYRSDLLYMEANSYEIFELYAQIETEQFNGGIVLFKFDDGSSKEISLDAAYIPYTPLHQTTSEKSQLFVGLSEADEDRAGSWDQFYGGFGRTSQIANDFEFYFQLYTEDINGADEIKSIVIEHTVAGEAWSTSDEKWNGKKLYPIVLTRDFQKQDSYQINSGYGDLDIQLGDDGDDWTYLRLYAQIESKQFSGGTMIVTFNDGSVIEETIPARDLDYVRIEEAQEDIPEVVDDGYYQPYIQVSTYIGYQDPFSRRQHDVMKQLENAYGDDIEIRYIHYPFSYQQLSYESAIAAECARQQGEFRGYHDLLMTNSITADYDFIVLANELSLDRDDFEDCYDNQRTAHIVDAGIESAERNSITGTPTTYIGSKVISGAQPYAVYKEAIENMYSGSDKPNVQLIGVSLTTQPETTTDGFTVANMVVTVEYQNHGNEQINLANYNGEIEYSLNGQVYGYVQLNPYVLTSGESDIITFDLGPESALNIMSTNVLKVNLQMYPGEGRTYDSEINHYFDVQPCSDSDGGINGYIPGRVSFLDVKFIDQCSNGLVQEYWCASDYNVGSGYRSCGETCSGGACQDDGEIPVVCPNIAAPDCGEGSTPVYEYEGSCIAEIYCSDTPSQPENPQLTCNGCQDADRCLPIGTRLIDDNEAVYCNFSGNLIGQSAIGGSCQNDYECGSNSCQSGQCVDLTAERQETQGLLRTIIDFFSRIFG